MPTDVNTAPAEIGPPLPQDGPTASSDAAVSSEAPASAEPPWWRRAAVAGAAVAGGCAAIALVDPSDSGVPVCWSQGIFGVDCPLCGGLRCVNSLVRGDLVAAADHNVLLAVALPVVAVLWAVWMLAAVRGRRLQLPRALQWLLGAAGVVVLAFTVARNVDGGPFIDWLAANRS